MSSIVVVCDIADSLFRFLPGLSGLLPQHPSTYRNAWRNRREFNMEKLQRQLQEEEEEEEEEGKMREEVSGEEKTRESKMDEQ